jgi:hypothetical protein
VRAKKTVYNFYPEILESRNYPRNDCSQSSPRKQGGQAMNDIEHELIATQWDLKVAKDRIKRLEKAGDKMHDWLMSKNRIGCDMEIASEWTRAKKNKP